MKKVSIPFLCAALAILVTASCKKTNDALPVQDQLTIYKVTQVKGDVPANNEVEIDLHVPATTDSVQVYVNKAYYKSVLKPAGQKGQATNGIVFVKTNNSDIELRNFPDQSKSLFITGLPVQ